MGWITKSSDADLQQSMDLVSEAAKESRQAGDHQREAAFHSDLNQMVTEAENRGWTQGSGWKPGRR